MNKNNKHIQTFIRARLLFFVILFNVSFSPALFSLDVESLYDAKVGDISDRKYQDALYDLIRNADESIIVSMYFVNVYGSEGEDPSVKYLLDELAKALDRGIDVEFYLNTRFRKERMREIYGEEPFKSLREKGAKVYLVDSTYQHHDKLVIVDSRYVIEGSHNWSVTAFKRNFESSTLIVSAELAAEKLSRIRDLPMESDRLEQVKKLSYFEGKFVFPPDKNIVFKKALLENESFFPKMVKNHADRAMDTYLLLLAYAQSCDQKKWGNKVPIFMEKLAGYLKIPETWSRTAKRRQIIKVLESLSETYGLISVEYDYNKEAWVSFTDLSGNTIEIDPYFFDPDFLAGKSATGQFMIFVSDLLEEEGKDVSSVPKTELGKRFHLNRNTIRKGLKEIESL
ncbi:MAG: hypothetical protein GF350_07760 [Chitinivibrionales bacterium]|nr:hypothetical protein [Chitinivibrionales bacterium]